MVVVGNGNVARVAASPAAAGGWQVANHSSSKQAALPFGLGMDGTMGGLMAAALGDGGGR